MIVQVLLRHYQVSFTLNRIEQQLDWIGVSSSQLVRAAQARCSWRMHQDCMHIYSIYNGGELAWNSGGGDTASRSMSIVLPVPTPP